MFFIATIGVWECRGRGIPSGHVHAGIACISHRSRRLHPASHRGLAARRQATWPIRWVVVTLYHLIIKKKLSIWAGPDVIALKKLIGLVEDCLPVLNPLWPRLCNSQTGFTFSGLSFVPKDIVNVFGFTSNPQVLQCKIQKKPTPCCCLLSSLLGWTLSHNPPLLWTFRSKASCSMLMAMVTVCEFEFNCPHPTGSWIGIWMGMMQWGI